MASRRSTRIHLTPLAHAQIRVSFLFSARLYSYTFHRPSERATAAELLQHEWLNSESSDDFKN